MVRKREAEDIPVTQGSGNVFADLGLAAPEEELNKAQLADISGRSSSAASQPGGRRCAHGDRLAKGIGVAERTPGEFSSERLMRLLTALGHDIEVTIKAQPRNRARGRIRITAATLAARAAGMTAMIRLSFCRSETGELGSRTARLHEARLLEPGKNAA
jgi:hypothetical protein